MKDGSKKRSVTRIGFYFDDDKLDWIRKNREMAGARSNSEFVNRAVEFYVGYLNSEQSQDYLIKTVSSMMDAKLDLTKNQTDGMIFKLAVEVAMQNRILAKTVKIGEDEIKKIRDKALDDVRKIWY